MALVLGCMIATGCSSCQSDKGKQETDKDTVVVVATELVVENTISVDREYIYVNYGDYRWYETCVLLKDYMDAECDGTVEGVSNVFQFMVDKEEGYDTWAVVSAYSNDAHVYDVRPGLWVGDFPLNDEEIKLSYKEAFDKMMAANYPKPHSRQCVLRREVGPVPNVAPQYIFGNNKAQLYVDAVTGDVSDTNPAFKGLEKPLIEWP